MRFEHAATGVMVKHCMGVCYGGTMVAQQYTPLPDTEMRIDDSILLNTMLEGMGMAWSFGWDYPIGIVFAALVLDKGLAVLGDYNTENIQDQPSSCVFDAHLEYDQRIFELQPLQRPSETKHFDVLHLLPYCPAARRRERLFSNGHQRRTVLSMLFFRKEVAEPVGLLGKQIGGPVCSLNCPQPCHRCLVNSPILLGAQLMEFAFHKTNATGDDLFIDLARNSICWVILSKGSNNS